MCMHIVNLPATEPGDPTYGSSPTHIASMSDLRCHQVCFQHMVWYNLQVRTEAVRQIEELGLDTFVLVGFSKSGLGAWHLAQTLPDQVTATIIFDAPMMRDSIPVEWGAGPFYTDDSQWLQDLPTHSVANFLHSVKPGHRLVLVSGAAFDEQMKAFSQVLIDAGCQHTFLHHPEIRHHWDSGWLELALGALQEN